MHRRRWRRLTGKPVRRFRRHVRDFVKSVARAADATAADSDLEDTVAGGPTLAPEMTAGHTSEHEVKGRALELAKGTAAGAIHAAETDKS